MDFTVLQMGMIGLGVFFSSVIQGAIGFAVGLIAIPIFLMAGMQFEQAILLVLFLSLIQNSYGLIRTWKELHVGNLWNPAIVRAACIPVGFGMMIFFASWDPARLRQMYGVIILVTLLLYWLLKIKPREKVHWGWTGLSMVTSGVSQGAVGAAGPPLVFWAMAHSWKSIQSRGALFFLFTVGAVPHLLIFAYKSSATIFAQSSLIALVVFPISVGGSTLGLWLGGKIRKRQLAILSFSVLTILGINLLFF